MGASNSSRSHPDGGLASDRQLFDFGRFLEGGALDDIFGIAPDTTPMPTPTPEDGKWEVTKLSGGMINVTVRVTPHRRDGELGRNRRSVVIKYAPPFIAAIGEDAPFGTFRQVIEYRALSLLGSTPSVTSSEAKYRVAIPRVLKFFEDDRVLVLQDLGEWMKPLESWMYPPTTSTAEYPPSLETCSSVGTRLGNILASVHCDATLLLKSQTLADNGNLWFENPEAKDFVRDKIVGNILPILRPWIDQDTGRAEKIAKIISQDFEHSFLDTLHPSSSPSSGIQKSMFSTGDLWTGSIIVGTSPAASSPNPNFGGTEVEVGLIDWEFATPGRIGQDITQLSAWLYLFSTSSVWSSGEPRRRHVVMDTTATLSKSSPCHGQFRPDFRVGVSGSVGVEGGTKSTTGEPQWWRSSAGSLLNALLKAYARKVKEYSTHAWFVDEDYDQRKYRKERLAVIRSIWILFGMEIIYDSVEAKDRFFAGCGDGGEREEEAKMWQRAVIEVGCWYVSRAGESTDEEFEVAVKNECLLGRMYTVSPSAKL